MKFLLLEPFYGGSHRDFADGLIRHSRFQIDLDVLPARFWKWRMRGAALYFYRNNPSLQSYDGLIVSGLMSLSDLRALGRGKLPPTLVYFHENQFSYPLAPGATMDYQFGFTDITTALAADQVVFNSRIHLDTFFEKLRSFLKMMPDYRPDWAVDCIREKSMVIYPGCHFSPAVMHSEQKQNRIPLIIWNHRWEFDKRPDIFRNVLTEVRNQGFDFRIALLGERYRRIPPAFRRIREQLSDRIAHDGFVESRKEYYRWLSGGDLVISTADQENFGIAMVEAIRHGCLPLLPDRLSYPEILPERFHSECLYRETSELTAGMIRFLRDPSLFAETRKNLSVSMAAFAWEKQIRRFDRVLAELPRKSLQSS